MSVRYSEWKHEVGALYNACPRVQIFFQAVFVNQCRERRGQEKRKWNKFFAPWITSLSSLYICIFVYLAINEIFCKDRTMTLGPYRSFKQTTSPYSTLWVYQEFRFKFALIYVALIRLGSDTPSTQPWNQHWSFSSLSSHHRRPSFKSKLDR